MSLKERFNNLDPKQKKIVIWSLVGATLLAVTLTGHNLRSDRATNLFSTIKKTREIQLEPDLIQKTMLREQRRQLEQLAEKLNKLEDQQSKASPPLQTPTEEEKSFPEIPSADELVSKPTSPQLPAEDQWPKPIGYTRQVSSPPPKEKQIIGAISVLSNPAISIEGEDPKKKGRTVYLPPSFMEAKLLTGFDASTSGKGSSNPEPLLLRIQTPAVLPNDIKANLKGCFVIAEAVGRLDKERADVRLVSLSCLSNEGRAIIDHTFPT